MFTKMLMAAVLGMGFVMSTGATTAQAGAGKPDSPEVTRLLQKADQLKRDKQLDEAIKVLDQVLAIDPRNSKAWSEGAWIFNEMEKYDIAIKASQNAIDRDANNADAYREMGYAFSQQGKYQDAVKMLATGLDLNKRDWVAYDYLVTALEKGGRSDLARQVKDIKAAEMKKAQTPNNIFGD